MIPSLDNKLPVAVKPAMLHNYPYPMIEEYTALLPERSWQRYPESVKNYHEENNDERNDVTNIYPDIYIFPLINIYPDIELFPEINVYPEKNIYPEIDIYPEIIIPWKGINLDI